MTTLLRKSAVSSSDALLQAILDNEETLLVEFSLDDFTIIRTNPRFRTLYSLNETDSTLDIDIFQQQPELYQLLSNKSQLIHTLSNTQQRVLKPHIIKQHLISWRIFALPDVKQQRRSIVLFGQDVTHYEPDETKLDTTCCSLESVVMHLPNNVYWMDKNAVNIGCNDNTLKFWGITRNEYDGSTCEELVEKGYLTAEQADSFVKGTMKVIQSGEATLYSEELPIIGIEGKTVRFLTSKVPIHNQLREVVGVVGISVDITERKEMEQALLHAKQLAEQHSKFLANMSHDVKTPLSGIVGLADLLLQRVNPQERELAQDIQEAARQLIIFFENCIELANIESGARSSTEESFNLRKLIGEIVSLFQPTIKTKGLTFRVEYAEDIPDLLTGDRSNLYRIILNLIGNAIKFTSQGSITIRVKLQPDSTPTQAIIQLSVIDTGIGIPTDKKQIIFERFARVASSTEKTYEGNGIGLNIVQTFANAMGGNITVESETAKGSHFIVTLPFKIPARGTHAGHQPNSPLLQSSIIESNTATTKASTPNINIEKNSKTNILLVEDNPMAQKVATLLLESLNCHVDLADNGKNAIKTFKAGKYDLVFMDIGLPDTKGYEVSKELREIEAGTSFRVPILGLSAHASLDEQRLSIEAGMDKVLNKPLMMNDTKVLLDQYVFSNRNN